MFASAAAQAPNDARASCGDRRSVILDVNYGVAQKEPMWCWAAVTQIAAEYLLGAAFRQCEIVSAIHRPALPFDSGQTQDRCCGAAGGSNGKGACDKGYWPNFEALPEVNLEKTNPGDYLSVDELKSQLNGAAAGDRSCKGAPVPFVWKYPAGTELRVNPDAPTVPENAETGDHITLIEEAKHAMLAAGYIENAGEDYIFVVDPNRMSDDGYIAGIETAEAARLRPRRALAGESDRSFMLYEYFVRQDKHHEHYRDYYELTVAPDAES
jgi:hypothetical protein